MKLQTCSYKTGLGSGGSAVSSSSPRFGATGRAATPAQTSRFSRQRCNLTVFHSEMRNKTRPRNPSNRRETDVRRPKQNCGPLFSRGTSAAMGWQEPVAGSRAGQPLRGSEPCPGGTFQPLTFRSKTFLSHRAQTWGKWRGAAPRRSPSWCGGRERAGRSGAPPLRSSFCLMRGLPKLCLLWLRRPKAGGAAALNFVSGVGSSGS